jgi:hypothetical protein
MHSRCSLALVLVGIVACGADRGSDMRATAIVVSPPAGASAPPADDPEDDWHDRTAPPIETHGARIYPWITWPPDSTLRYYGSRCQLARSGVFFFACSLGVVRVDGTRMDLQFGRSAPADLDQLQGTYPNDLWARPRIAPHPLASPYGDERSSKVRPSPGWLRYHAGTWTAYRSEERPMPYVKGTSILPNDPVPKGVPTFVTMDGVPAPDFSSLEGKIEWLVPRFNSWAFAIDEAGPVHVLLNAYEPSTKRKGWGIASWTPADGARFSWLPSPLDTKTELAIEWTTREAGRLGFQLGIDHGAKYELHVVELDGATWKDRKINLPLPPAPPRGEEVINGFKVDKGVLFHEDASGAWTPVPPFNDTEHAVAEVVAAGPNDTWIVSRGAIHRTVRPDETLRVLWLGDAPHVWPSKATSDCKHPLLVLDLVPELAHVPWKVPDEWGHFEGDDLLEMHFGGMAMIAVPFRDMTAAKARQEASGASRGMEGWSPELVCARPVRPKPYHPPPPAR